MLILLQGVLRAAMTLLGRTDPAEGPPDGGCCGSVLHMQVLVTLHICTKLGTKAIKISKGLK